MSRHRAYALVATAAVIAGLVCGFLLLGSPGYQRQVQADTRRVEDLQAIGRELHQRHAAANAVLPATLQELAITRTDPITAQHYTYLRADNAKYKLCATFALESRPDTGFWHHPAGQHCFALDASGPVW